MDVIFYFVMSLLVATILCYVIFLVKNSFQRKDIEEAVIALQSVGTSIQKDQEKEVISYQQKIKDFSEIFKNQGFASQVFSFLQKETRPNVWYERFSLNQKGATVDLPGESDDNEALSRQVAVFEKSEYVKNINVLSSALGESSAVKFNLALTLDSKIFNYNPDLNPAPEVVEQPEQSAVQTENQPAGGENSSTAKNSEKLIIIFKFLQPIQADGAVDLKKNTIVIDVPFGTDITNLTPYIVVSPKASIEPKSDLPQNFTSPVVYKVTAEDGSTQDYNVSVNVLPKSAGKSSKFAIILTMTLLILAVIAAIIGAFFMYKKNKTIQQIQ